MAAAQKTKDLGRPVSCSVLCIDITVLIFCLGRFEDDSKQDRDYEEDDYDHPRGLGAAPSRALPVDVSLTGDEAYQRRLAMSRGFQPAASPAPAPSAPAFTTVVGSSASSDIGRPPSQDLDDDVPSVPPVRTPVVETGEEAYLRRLALSQSKAAEPVPRAVAKTPEPAALAYNPFVPSASVPPPSAAGLPASGSALSDDKVRSGREAAAAIAAKLRALKPSGPGASSGTSTPPNDAEQSSEAPKKYAHSYTHLEAAAHRFRQIGPCWLCRSFYGQMGSQRRARPGRRR